MNTKKLIQAAMLLALPETAAAVEDYSFTTKIRSVQIYPQPVTPEGVKYTELLITVTDNMVTKPNCATNENRLIIDSNNPSFPYVYGLVMVAKKNQSIVSINYWNMCEASRIHMAPVIRSITLD
ncbi:hypothetical protein ACSLBF_09615 [Pseudoalteromonas sp. T1lg65]|uniref:hypothetical protein n=1 Tax=Pseudoalteromonas sp. T1lg65 TaxID=2077101 RepID=UPI003F79E39F